MGTDEEQPLVTNTALLVRIDRLYHFLGRAADCMMSQDEIGLRGVLPSVRECCEQLSQQLSVKG